MDYRRQNIHSALALVLSLVLHALLLLGLYYLPLNLSGKAPARARFAQRTTLSRAAPLVEPQAQHPSESEALLAQDAPPIAPSASAEQTQEEALTDMVPTPPEQVAPTASTAPPQEEVASGQEEATPPADNLQLDERGLYKAYEGAQTGITLELPGWTWDTVPQPQDDTEENGTIVFEITIDDLGEVIAVKTLDKTISPLVEKIYKDALIKLTFSKTAERSAYAPTTTGKITFILRAQ